jgi:hypothetical protein
VACVPGGTVEIHSRWRFAAGAITHRMKSSGVARVGLIDRRIGEVTSRLDAIRTLVTIDS